MAIKRIKVKNFKSFKELDQELGDLNILIGANASGKSNFVQIFKFLRDIRSHGLENAISMQGGIKYLRNINIGVSDTLSLEITSEPGVELSEEAREEAKDIRIYELVYGFAIQFNEQETGFEIIEDKLTLKIGATSDKEIILSNFKGKIEITPPANGPNLSDLGLDFLELLSGMPLYALLLENPFFFSYIPFPSFIFGLRGEVAWGRADSAGLSVYDFDPKLIKEYLQAAGKIELDYNGANLAIVLESIMATEDGKRKLLNLVTYLLDFVDDLDVERRAMDRAFLLKLREKYFEEPLPVFSISDGTVNMLALIIALYFDKRPLTIIEEPERNIHPYLISRVVDMMEDASQNKQIIVTTHNPEMVRYANKDDLLLISRDEDGYSTVSRPSEKEDMKIFLKNGLRMEDLYVDSLLETL